MGRVGGGAEKGREVSAGLTGKEEVSAGDEKVRERQGVSSPLGLLPSGTGEAAPAPHPALQLSRRFHLSWGCLSLKEVEAR